MDIIDNVQKMLPCQVKNITISASANISAIFPTSRDRPISKDALSAKSTNLIPLKTLGSL